MRSTLRLSQLLRTKLNDFHREQGGKMVDFEGWEMPVQYKAGVLKEHHGCRENAAIFDVGHMGQCVITGKDRDKFLEYVTPVCMNIPEGHAKLSVLTNAKGGVIDDCLIHKQADYNFLVINAGCIPKDLKHLNEVLAEFKGDVQLEHLDKSMIALQGPNAMSILQNFVKGDLTKVPFMTASKMDVGGLDCYVTRCGYTGEDGFEISVANESIVTLVSMFMERGATLSGLGARDSLRLEAGLCLYGHELNQDISPIEGGLLFVIPKHRREAGGFIGFDRIKADMDLGVKLPSKRVGIVTKTGPPPRQGSKVFSADGTQEIGECTSGGPSPTLGNKQNIAQGYLKNGFRKIGNEVLVDVRGKKIPGVVSRLPFVETKYHRVD